MTVPLLAAWSAALPPEADPALAEAAGRDLMTRWSQPQRHYHTLDHLAFMLAVVDAADPGAGPADLSAVRLAAWFHDAVYDPRGTDNEARSARLAEAVLPTLRVGERDVAEVARLVLVTADHEVAPGDAAGALLVDADLAILGTSPETYRAYARAVRAEYAHVPDDAFRAGRAAVLRRILALPVLYHLPAHRAAWDARARANLTTEIASLTAAA